VVPAQSRRSLQQGPLRRDATTTSFLWLSGTTSEHRYWSDTSPPIGRSRLPSGQRDRPPPTEKEEGPQSCGPPLRTRGAQHQFRHVGATTTPAPAHPPRAATTCLPVAAQARARPPAERPVHGLLRASPPMEPTVQPNGHVCTTCGAVTGSPNAELKLRRSRLKLGLVSTSLAVGLFCGTPVFPQMHYRESP